MKTKDLIKALQRLDPDSNVVINVKQRNKRWGTQYHIEYGHKSESGDIDRDELSYLGCWVNNSYGGSITIHLPEGVSLMDRRKNKD